MNLSSYPSYFNFSKSSKYSLKTLNLRSKGLVGSYSSIGYSEYF